MRIDARRGSYVGWVVWHVPRCQMLRHVVWVDDSTHQWGEYVFDHMGRPMADLRPYGLEPRINVFQAKQIEIMADRRLVLIDPIDDPDAEDELNELELLEINPDWGQVYVKAKDTVKKALGHK